MKENKKEYDLALKTSYGLIEPITSNDIPVCIECGSPITKENDSGWERFTGKGATTQPICKYCQKDEPIMKKN